MTTEGMSGAPLQIKLQNAAEGKEEEFEWLTIGVHNGFGYDKENKGKGVTYATLITDDVFLNFIYPMIDRLTYDFGGSAKRKKTEKDIL